MKRKKIIIIIISIFLLALFLRVYRLSGVDIGSDEGLWMERGSHMITELAGGNFRESVKNFERHPGIPAAFLMGVSMKILGEENTKYQYNIAVPVSFSFRILDPLTAARLPIAILGALTCVFLFVFVYKIFSFWPALFSSLFLTLSPFHIAGSRMAHQDVALGFFIIISIIIYYLAEKEKKGSLKVLAGIFFGLAFLTKISALIIPLVIFIWKISIYVLKNKREGFKKENIFTYADLAFIFIGLIMFFGLYPNMWDSPPASFTKHFLQNFGERAVKDDHFFKGINTHEKTPLFYPYSIVFRTPAFVLILFLVGLFTLIKNFLKGKKREFLLLLFLLFFVSLFSLMETSKVQERYLIPFWWFIPFFASIGITYLLKSFHLFKKAYLTIMAAIIIFLGSFIFIKNTPNFYLYYGLFSGSPKNIMETMPIGRGEGFSEAAHYLNQKQKEAGQKLNVFSTYSKFFKTYSESNVIGWNDRKWTEENIYEGIDYYVIYVRDIQHHSPDLLYRKIFLERKPEKVIKLNGIDVVWIFKN